MLLEFLLLTTKLHLKKNYWNLLLYKTNFYLTKSNYLFKININVQLILVLKLQ